jgi:hypothetical protein
MVPKEQGTRWVPEPLDTWCLKHMRLPPAKIEVGFSVRV